MNDLNAIWRVKLGARLHDPAEKALVLMRDPGIAHDQGTVRRLRDELLRPPLTEAEEKLIKTADHWAAAGDRPQFPIEENKRWAKWAQVDFSGSPELIHPLSGERYQLGSLGEIGVEQIKAVSLDHFQALRGDDSKRTALAFWRFGPSHPAPELGALWELLPADTRVPDHSIWAHLDLVSALAGAFAADDNHQAALLAVSLGPVQEFIAVARKASDLWAGSHLLSRLAWEAMKVVCEQLGPDAVLFPQLRGVPLVDAWLQRECGLDEAWFRDLPWRTRASDANPLFAASLPNKFVALVPAGMARELATTIENRVRAFALEQATAAASMLAQEIGTDAEPLMKTCREQLAGFPEIYWAAVPWLADPEELRQAGAPFGGGAFFASNAWKLLAKEVTVQGQKFFSPNPGTLYPELYDLANCLLAAAKFVRPFTSLAQSEPRCKRCGERTSLGGTDFWESVAAAEPHWAKPKEHLCAVCALKRLWPHLFTKWARSVSGISNLDSYNVSTHTMALATTFGRLADRHDQGEKPDCTRLAQLLRAGNFERVALPRSLAKPRGELDTVMRLLPNALDRDQEDEANQAQTREIVEAFKALADDPPENYYALIKLDGDRMGAWLSGGEGKTLTFGAGWHTQVRNQVQTIAELQSYLAAQRPVSPARHTAISEALHAFSQTLAPYVVEELFKGKLIYAGGDDLLAMISVDDLLPCLSALRAVYRGDGFEKEKLKSGGGFAVLRGQLHRVMGNRATLSAGAVIAHFMNPLSRVLRELDGAEKAAKHAGRDAVSIRLLKRSGGATHLTLPFQAGARHPVADLENLRDAFAHPELSRRAAYHIVSQLPLLPPDPDPDLFVAIMAYQFDRQGGKHETGRELANSAVAIQEKMNQPNRRAELDKIVRGCITLAEFLAREGRSKPEPQSEPEPEKAEVAQ